MTETISITVTVNGVKHTADVEPRLLLADFIRENLDLTGTHVGCEHGICGACTILMNGDSVRSCLTFAVQVDGAEIETVESLGDAENLNPLQQAFREHHALQCGFCTPGMLMTAAELLAQKSEMNRQDIREFMSGNYCRCTGYHAIVDAIESINNERLKG